MNVYLTKTTTTGLPVWQSLIWWVAGIAATTAAMFVLAI